MRRRTSARDQHAACRPQSSVSLPSRAGRKPRSTAFHHVDRDMGDMSLSTPDGPCKGVSSPDAWHAVPLQPGIGLNRPALESMPPLFRKHSKAAKHHCETPSGSQMSLSTPDGQCKGVPSPDAWHAVHLQPGIGIGSNRSYSIICHQTGQAGLGLAWSGSIPNLSGPNSGHP